MGEKLEEKYRDEDMDRRQYLIDKALDKQHRKGFVGVRLHQENMRMMQLSKRLGKHAKMTQEDSAEVDAAIQ